MVSTYSRVGTTQWDQNEYEAASIYLSIYETFMIIQYIFEGYFITFGSQNVKKYLPMSLCNSASQNFAINFNQKCSNPFFKTIFVISGVLALVWKAFIKFNWHGQITTLSCSLMSPTCFSMSFLCSTLASFMEFALATCFSIQANIASQLSHHSWSVELMFPMSSWKKKLIW